MHFLFPQAFCLSDPTIFSLFNNRSDITNKKGISFLNYKMFDKNLYKAGTFECFRFFVFHGNCGFFNLFTTTHADSGLE
jgi:hypothetical protein